MRRCSSSRRADNFLVPAGRRGDGAVRVFRQGRVVAAEALRSRRRLPAFSPEYERQRSPAASE